MFPLNHPEADRDLEEAALYYENCSAGLGMDFLNEYTATLYRILDSPETYAIYYKNFRRIMLNRFPFGIVYEIYKDHIYVLAVMNLHKKPYYWLDRI